MESLLKIEASADSTTLGSTAVLLFVEDEKPYSPDADGNATYPSATVDVWVVNCFSRSYKRFF